MNIQTGSVGHKTEQIGINVGKRPTGRVGGQQDERRLQEGRCENYLNTLYICVKLSKKKLKNKNLQDGKGVIP